MHSPVISFTSDQFHPIHGEEEDTNPGVIGKALAMWLSNRMRESGIETGPIVPEDFAWCITVPTNRFPLYVSCANCPGREGHWQICAFSDAGVLANALFGGRVKDHVETLHGQLQQLVQESKGLSNICVEPNTGAAL